MKIGLQRGLLLALALTLLFCCAATALAQEEVFEIEPAQSHVEFTLGDILHTVHGSFQLKPGTIHFDPATGTASGQLVVDAASGDSGNGMRDRKMKRDVLETAKYPDIVFAVGHVSGSLPKTGAGKLEISGNFILHGASHPLTLSIPVQVSGGQASADVHFDVPYVQWGLKNPSTLFLRVSKDVQIAVHAVGVLHPAGTATSAAR